MKLPRLRTSVWLATIGVAVLLAGLVLIVLYAAATRGPHLKYAVVGMLTAAAALGVGVLVGFVLGVPKAVSSGETRIQQKGTGQWDYSPSTNLAEISDWLTKLLLGAGLVGLTQLGRPLGSLINIVASGLDEASTPGNANGSAQVMAGSILCTYLVIGVLVGYLVTTLWYFAKLKGRDGGGPTRTENPTTEATDK